MKTKFIYFFLIVFASSLWANSSDNFVFSSFYEENNFKEKNVTFFALYVVKSAKIAIFVNCITVKLILTIAYFSFTKIGFL